MISYRQADLLDKVKPKPIGTIDVYIEPSDIEQDHSCVTVAFTGDRNKIDKWRKLVFDSDGDWKVGRTGTRLSPDNFFLFHEEENMYARGLDESDVISANLVNLIREMGLKDTIDDNTSPVEPIDLEKRFETFHVGHFDIY